MITKTVNLLERSDIDPKWLFILDTYKATDNFIREYNINSIESNQSAETIEYRIKSFNRFSSFEDLVRCSFVWPNNQINYWLSIAKQNEQAIFK